MLLTQVRKKSGRTSHIAPVLISELVQRPTFLGRVESNVHEHLDREHGKRHQCWSLQQETEHDDDEGDILRMVNARIATCCRQHVVALCLIQHLP